MSISISLARNLATLVAVLSAAACQSAGGSGVDPGALTPDLVPDAGPRAAVGGYLTAECSDGTFGFNPYLPVSVSVDGGPEATYSAGNAPAAIPLSTWPVGATWGTITVTVGVHAPTVLHVQVNADGSAEPGGITEIGTPHGTCSVLVGPAA